MFGDVEVGLVVLVDGIGEGEPAGDAGVVVDDVGGVAFEEGQDGEFLVDDAGEGGDGGLLSLKVEARGGSGEEVRDVDLLAGGGVNLFPGPVHTLEGVGGLGGVAGGVEVVVEGSLGMRGVVVEGEVHEDLVLALFLGGRALGRGVAADGGLDAEGVELLSGVFGRAEPVGEVGGDGEFEFEFFAGVVHPDAVVALLEADAGEEFLGPGPVLGVGIEFSDVSLGEPGGDLQVGEAGLVLDALAGLAHGDGGVLVAVNDVGEGLADLFLVEGVDVLVEPEAGAGAGGAGEDFQVRDGLDLLDVGGGVAVGAVVHLIGENEGEGGGRFAVVDQDLVEVALAGVVAGGILDQFELGLGDGGGVEDEGAVGDDGVGLEGVEVIHEGLGGVALGVLALGAEVGGLIHPLAVDGVGGGLVGAEDEAQDAGRGGLDPELDGGVIHGDDILEVGPDAVILGPVDVVGADEVQSGQRGAVAPLHPRSQLHRQDVHHALGPLTRNGSCFLGRLGGGGRSLRWLLRGGSRRGGRWSGGGGRTAGCQQQRQNQNHTEKIELTHGWIPPSEM